MIDLSFDPNSSNNTSIFLYADLSNVSAFSFLILYLEFFLCLHGPGGPSVGAEGPGGLGFV